jgi:hypothetical protein
MVYVYIRTEHCGSYKYHASHVTNMLAHKKLVHLSVLKSYSTEN